MIEKKDIPKQVLDVIFGYGSQYLMECAYAYEKAEYLKARDFASDKTRVEHARDIDNMEYYGAKMTVIHEAWVKLQYNEEKHPWSRWAEE